MRPLRIRLSCLRFDPTSIRRLSLFLFSVAFVIVLARAVVAQEIMPVEPPSGIDGVSGVGSRTDREYRVLDNIEGRYIDFGFAPIRPMLLLDDQTQFYALNVHDSKVLHWDLPTITPLDPDTGFLTGTDFIPTHVWSVPWGPVAMANWDGPRRPELLVVSQGNHVLTRIDRRRGEIIATLELPHEPADILVDDDRDVAYISCQGARAVVKVDLATNRIVDQFRVPGTDPTFLSRLSDGRILVAPMLSGNNTMVDPPNSIIDAGPRGVLDLTDPSIAVTGLPDEDLFQVGSGIGAVPAFSGVGTILFEHAQNPVTGELWVLNTDARNAGSNQGEPQIAGHFSENRITIIDPDDPSDIDFVTLDHLEPTASPYLYYSVGQPYALDFTSDGYGIVVGTLSNVVTLCAPDGEPIYQWPLAAGTIPRDVIVVETELGPTFAGIYCWGSNTVEVFNLLTGPPTQMVPGIDLGHDPAPANIRHGRELFFEGANSANGGLACATCHIEGGSDLLAWNLGRIPEGPEGQNALIDDKGPLVTQFLQGIEPLAPFHWRGERHDLKAFNVAFEGLLGGEELDDADFADFEAFVFSLQHPANANEGRDRKLIDHFDKFIHSVASPGPISAIAGQDHFFDTPTIGTETTCTVCHAMPTGTNNDTFPDEPANVLQPKRVNFVVAPLNNGVWRKEPSNLYTVELVSVDPDDADGIEEVTVPNLGTAISAAGQVDTMFDFVKFFNGDDQLKLDITSFLHQFDSGIAPTVHRGRLIDFAHLDGAAAFLFDELRVQAEQRNCDVAAFGRSSVNGVTRELRWFWDRHTGMFRANTDTVAPVAWSFFIDQAETHRGSHIVVGMPVGMAETWAVDADGDGFYDLDDPNPYVVDPYTLDDDTDPPVVEYVKTVFVTTKVAKIHIDTDEPTMLNATYVDPSAVVHDAFESPTWSRHHVVLLTDLEPNQGYTVQLRATDRSGLVTDFGLAEDLQTLDFIAPVMVKPTQLHVTDVQNESATAIQFDLQAIVTNKRGEPQGLSRLVASVYVNLELRSTLLIGALSDVDGVATIDDIVIDDLAPGDEVIVNLDFVTATIVDGDGELVELTNRWTFPDTLPADRALEFIWPDYSGVLLTVPPSTP